MVTPLIRPLRLLLLLPSLLLLSATSITSVAAQQDQVTTTVIDIISSNPEFSIFLRLLQRNQLIPYINQLESITLVVPINSAFVASYPQLAAIKDNDQDEIIEGFNIKDLNRYIVDQPISSNNTLGFHILHTKPYEYDQDKEHEISLASPISIQSNKKESTFLINDITVIERDLYADTQNSYVQGVLKTFDHILPLKDTLEKIQDTSIVQRLLNTKARDLSNNTLLLFKDTASKFKDHQLNYLLNEQYGASDATYILNSLLVPGYHGGIIEKNLTDSNNFEIRLSSSENGSVIRVNSTIISSHSNIIASDGVIHIFDVSEIIQRIEFNALKTLVGLDCASFVEELLFQNFDYLLTNNSLKQTIFHTKDSNSNSDFKSQSTTIQSKSDNLYHFIKDENLRDLNSLNTTLFSTNYCSSKKLGSKDHCQRLKIAKLGEDSIVINNNVLVEQGPFEVGDTSIYIIDEDLRTPNDLLSSVSPLFECSKYLGYLHRLNLHKLENHENGYTYFLPCFGSLYNFDLTFKYLERNSTALKTVMKSLVIEDLLYSDYRGGDFNTTDLSGSLVQLQNFVPSNENLSLDFNDIELNIIKADDIIFDQGVAQPIDKFLIPESVLISNTDLLQTFDTKLFQKYLSFFPHLSNMVNNHSLLIPGGLSLSKFQFEKNSTLEDLLQVHILPKESALKVLTCGEETQDIVTLNPKVNLTCTRPADHDTFLSVKGDEDLTNRVRILAKGCVNNDQDLCIFEIDKPIESNTGHFHLNLPGVAFAVGILLGSLSMVLILVCLMLVVLRHKKERATENHNEDHYDVDEDTIITGTHVDENTTLLQANINANNFENGYSEMANTTPIAMRKPSKVDFSV